MVDVVAYRLLNRMRYGCYANGGMVSVFSLTLTLPTFDFFSLLFSGLRVTFRV